MKLVHGVGINDADYQVNLNESGLKRSRIWMCPIYQVWANMIARCYSARYQAMNPSYIGCTVSPEWHYFSEFKAWMEGRHWQGMQIDKDLLLKGNKVYGPEACVFVSNQLNSFIGGRSSSRGDCPAGVFWSDDHGKFRSMCCNPFTGKREHLGFFTDPDVAHEAWRAKKHQHACRYADMQSDQRIAQALRTRYAKQPEGETA